MAKGNPGPKRTRSTVVPTLRYHDPDAALDWLCRAFGFKPHLVVRGEDGKVEHTELSFGNGMIVMGPKRGDEFGKLVSTSRELGGANIMSAYLIVQDADAHYARAKKAGARIVYEIRSEDYGGRGYSCLDPEGNLWSFGTYDPWNPPKVKTPPAKKAAAKRKAAARKVAAKRKSPRRARR